MSCFNISARVLPTVRVTFFGVTPLLWRDAVVRLMQPAMDLVCVRQFLDHALSSVKWKKLLVASCS